MNDLRKDLEKQTNVFQKCLAVNKKLLVEKVSCAYRLTYIYIYMRDAYYFSRRWNENKHARNVWRTVFGSVNS
jgi:hypothetical protein